MRSLFTMVGTTLWAMGCIGPIPPLPDDAPDLGEIADGGVADAAPNSPFIGAVETISLDGVVSGWARHVADDDAIAWVRLSLDVGTENARSLGTLCADRSYRESHGEDPDGVGDHAFQTRLPDAALDGRQHALAVSALDTDGGETGLTGSPVTFRAGLNSSPPFEVNPPPDRNPPQGVLDGVTEQGAAFGWAFDLDVRDRPLQVHFYVDGSPYDGGEYLGSTLTDEARPDVTAEWDHPGLHGFTFRLPPRLLDGRGHQLRAYAFNVGHPGNVLLFNAPSFFQLTAGGETSD